MESLLQEIQADPAKAAQMDAVIKAHPDRRARAAAEMERMQREVVKLLGQEDAADLRLTLAELQPWLEMLARRSAEAALSGANSPEDAAARKAFEHVFWSTLDEMTPAIFQPERIRQLIAALRKYRTAQHAAGNQQRALFATHALLSLQPGQEPAHNPFLEAVCFVSLRLFINELASSDPEDEVP